MMSAGRQIHLVGFLLERPTIRLTTAVVSLWERRAITSSGRHYTLVGDPAVDEEAKALIELRAIDLGLDWCDVTDFYWPMKRGAAPWCSVQDPSLVRSGS
jgi:hypothetical protein